ncbi:MAG: phosphoribosylamine--glycine ligase [Syntrophomonadaceae bacterium]|nr:phosphoribosylamine--glycine ligase [Syntrophomonadaceae bacterium]
MGKRVLVIGQGGREHALVWKISHSPIVERIYAAPGNPGIGLLAECIDIKSDDIDRLLAFAKANQIDLTVVGPEIPLMNGIVDRFRREGLKIFGPTAMAARIEGSKVFAKNLFKKYGIPTAEYEVFDNAVPALEYIKALLAQGKRPVIKADGLAAGKGVVVADGWDEARQAIEKMMTRHEFGRAGERIVVEECLAGEEVSLFVLSDGKHFIPLIAAQDHKRVFDDDQGPNTGGMGAYAKPPIYTPELHNQVIKTVIEPVISAMEQEDCPFTGVLYAGLMITPQGPKVLEFNARFGDPETQVIMPLIKNDIVPLMEATCDGKLSDMKVELEDGTCVCVVVAAGGYPGSYEKGKVIEGMENLEKQTLVFHAGTRYQDGQLVTNGGRVMALARRAPSFKQAIDEVYNEVYKIQFENMHYRKDIGLRALK